MTPEELSDHVIDEVFEHICNTLEWGIDSLNEEYDTHEDTHELLTKAFKLWILNNIMGGLIMPRGELT